MKCIVVTLGVVSEEARQAIDLIMFNLGVYSYELTSYGLREADAENEKRTFALKHHLPMTKGYLPMTKGYLRRRLTQLLKTRLQHEPPCDISEVVAVLYEPSLKKNVSPHWDEVAREFRAPVYRVRPHGDGVVEIEFVAD